MKAIPGSGIDDRDHYLGDACLAGDIERGHLFPLLPDLHKIDALVHCLQQAPAVLWHVYGVEIRHGLRVIRCVKQEGTAKLL